MMTLIRKKLAANQREYANLRFGSLAKFAADFFFWPTANCHWPIGGCLVVNP
ncbi:MAG TPA: hypothetical protein VGK24_12475 [Candidatus Angelobacter sp.]|jgi:hypothetical protein